MPTHTIKRWSTMVARFAATTADRIAMTARAIRDGQTVFDAETGSWWYWSGDLDDWVEIGSGGGVAPFALTGGGFTALEALEQIGYTFYNQPAALIGVTRMVWNLRHAPQGIDLELCPDLESLEFPALVDCEPGTGTVGDYAYFWLSDAPKLTQILIPVLTRCDAFSVFACPLLTLMDLSGVSVLTLELNGLDAYAQAVVIPTVGTMTSLSVYTSGLLSFAAPAVTGIQGGIEFVNNPDLATVDLSALETIGYVNVSGNPALTNIDLSALTSWGAGNPQFLDNNGLTEACVNALLLTMRAVWDAGAAATKTVHLEGGTNAAPSGAGAAALASLTGDGATITTN